MLEESRSLAVIYGGFLEHTLIERVAFTSPRLFNKQHHRRTLHKNTNTITIKTTKTQMPEPEEKDMASPILFIVVENIPVSPLMD